MTDINKLIHEHIFGECWHEPDETGYTANCIKCNAFLGRREKEYWMNRPDYSGSIADAWKVVEKMREEWLSLNEHEPFFWKFEDCAQYGWVVDVMHAHHDGDGEIFSFPDKSLPLAICRAALSAIGIDLAALEAGGEGEK